MHIDGRRYRATVRVRCEGKFTQIKPGTEVLDGKQVTVEALWQIGDESEIYEGEWAMGGADPQTHALLEQAGIAWIASGDLQFADAN